MLYYINSIYDWFFPAKEMVDTEYYVGVEPPQSPHKCRQYGYDPRCINFIH